MTLDTIPGSWPTTRSFASQSKRPKDQITTSAGSHSNATGRVQLAKFWWYSLILTDAGIARNHLRKGIDSFTWSENCSVNIGVRTAATVARVFLRIEVAIYSYLHNPIAKSWLRLCGLFNLWKICYRLRSQCGSSTPCRACCSILDSRSTDNMSQIVWKKKSNRGKRLFILCKNII